MKHVKIVYNPFLLTTQITVDGRKPEINSSLDFQKQRLQEWAEKLPHILLAEYKDRSIEIEFTGTSDDFSDLKEIVDANAKSEGISVQTYKHHPTLDVEEVEKQIVEIYEEIKKGPVASLKKDENIKKAFDKALGAMFTINVVATMSSGKSSLINAILGVNLMPVANMATTATIVSLIATPREGYLGIARGKNDKEIERHDNLDIKKMREWNQNKEISSIEIYGPIPCVKSVGMRLVLVDTPGPNNSRDDNHRALTYSMLEKSENSLVLFVMNAEALNINDEKAFLDYVCECMKKGGKQSRERFIFAVNKLDIFNPHNGDSVKVALNSVKDGLDDRDIKNPNLFPVSALAAFEIRTNPTFPQARGLFEQKCNLCGTEFHFDNYYDFNHLPTSSRSRINGSGNDLLIHTGIPSIEEAIRLYVNKYARTMKVKDLVDAFNNRLKELKTEAEIEQRIQHNESEKKRLEQEIERIQRQVTSGNAAKEYIGLIDKIDVSKDVKEEVDELLGGLFENIDDIIFGYNDQTRIARREAERTVERLEDKRKDMQSQVEARVAKITERTLTRTYDRIITEYRKQLSQLGFKSDDGAFEFNPINMVEQNIPDLNKIIGESTSTVDEGKNVTTYVTATRTVRRSNFIARFLFGTYKTEEYKKPVTEWVANYVQYVDIRRVVNEYFVPLQVQLTNLQKAIPQHVQSETARIKSVLKDQLSEIDKALREKLKGISQKLSSREKTDVELKTQKEQLEWMKGIIKRINELVNY